MVELVQFLASSLLGGSEQIQVREIGGDQTTVIELEVESKHIGKIIGRQGRTANALRTLVNVAALKAGKRVVLEIIETGNAGARNRNDS
ncbi:KH domain-containing protein [bacterium]|nr:KH domain-containing protein [candidate division CSSED10-310 bacterium]